MLTLALVLALVLLPAARAELPATFELIEADPGWPVVSISGAVDRPETLADEEIIVAASADKGSPAHDLFLAATPIGADDRFTMSVPIPPGGVHLWVQTTAAVGPWEDGFHQLYNHYPLHPPAQGLEDVVFTMADYRLTFEGVDPWSQARALWWWTIPPSAVVLLGLFFSRARGSRSRVRRLGAPVRLAPLPRERWWMVGILLLALLLRLPSLGESLSMTEFIHKQIANRSQKAPERAPVEAPDVSTCHGACVLVVGGELVSCTQACLGYFGQDTLPEAVTACLYEEPRPTPAYLLGCLDVGEGP